MSSRLFSKDPIQRCFECRSVLIGKKTADRARAIGPQYLRETLTRIKQRTRNRRNPSHIDYGQRGITLCKGFEDPAEFCRLVLETLGPRPEGTTKGGKMPKYTLDRIDNDLGYWCGACPECTENAWSWNLQWTDEEGQASNTRQNQYLTLDDRTQTINQWARELNKSLGLTRENIKDRRQAGWSDERILTTPVRAMKAAPIIWKGKTQSLVQLAKHLGVKYPTFWYWLNTEKISLAEACERAKTYVPNTLAK